MLIDYERCIGCRYCVAACPYGVRVFNWGDAKREPDFTIGYGRDYRTGGRLVFTPERPTGVVEKCTPCVERIDDGSRRSASTCARPGRAGGVWLGVLGLLILWGSLPGSTNSRRD